MMLPASHIPESSRQLRAVRDHSTAMITRLRTIRKMRRGDRRIGSREAARIKE